VAVALGLAAAVIVAIVVVVVVIGGGSHSRGRVPAPPRPTTTSPPPAPKPPGEQFGASVNLLFTMGGLTGTQVEAQLKALRAAGATLARTDAPWELSEPSPPVGGVHHYHWTFDDVVAASLAVNRLRWLPIVDYSAGWARSVPGQDHSPPLSDADYAAYARALAARYGLGGLFWRAHPELPALPVQELEIWNEPDSVHFWTPYPDAGRYARLYGEARSAIHAVDPSALVLVGGLSAATTFLPQLLAADPRLRGRIDGVAIHPYAGSPAAVLGNVVATRRMLGRLGLSTVLLFVSEFGWTTSPPGALGYLPARLRPGYIQRTLQALASSGCGVAGTILYTWYSPQRDPRNAQDWFGISPPGAGGGPDVLAFAAGLRYAAQAPPRGRSC
jgi:hypothetical protein